MKLEREIVDKAFKSLMAVPGLKPEDWMLMHIIETDDTWNGTQLYAFKSRDTRLYIFIPSRWGFNVLQDESIPVIKLRG